MFPSCQICLCGSVSTVGRGVQKVTRGRENHTEETDDAFFLAARVLVSTVGSDFRLIVLSSKEPFVHEAKGLDVFFTPTKRYQEVDGVRKEKERLTTDRLAT
jgi:hypothetical protein